MKLRILLVILNFSLSLTSQTKPRARQVGISFEGTPGPLNAITDVPGVEVGHRTLISGTSIRSGVTAVWPRGKASNDPVFSGFFSQNGNGDMTGTHWLEESGFLDGPVLITNTHSVGVVRDAYLAWLVKNSRKPGTNVFAGGFYTYPVVAETYDGFLNDINGFHVKPEDAAAALDSAAAGPVPEGNVGSITGTRVVGGTVDITLPSGTQSATNGVTSSNSVSNGILSGYITVGKTDWAAKSTNNVIALAAGSYTNDAWAAANNTTVTASGSVPAASSTNSLRFNAAAANTVTLTGTSTNIVVSGGVMSYVKVRLGPASVFPALSVARSAPKIRPPCRP